MGSKTKYPPGSVAALLRSWRYFFGFVALLGLAALFYFEENWRGARAWQNFKQRPETRGKRFDAKAYVPPVVPPGENFAMTPFLAPLFDFIPGTQKWRSTNALAFVNGFAPAYDHAARAVKTTKSTRSNTWLTTEIDLVTWRTAYLQSTTRIDQPADSVSREEAAEAVLTNLEECDDVLNELRESSHRRYSRFNLRYDNDDPAAILLPHLAALKHVCQVLHLRATAELALGKTDQALDDIILMLRLADASREEPIIISQLVRFSMLYMALEPMASGFGQWSEPQLNKLDDRLQRFDFCRDVKRSLEGEQILFGLGIIEFLQREPDKFDALAGDGKFPAAIWSAVPHGWFEFEKLNYIRFFDQSILPSIDATNRRINPTTCRQLEQRMTMNVGRSRVRLFLGHRAFSSLLLPDRVGIARKTAFAESAVDAAKVACAIERFRLLNGRLPKSLEQLAPKFLEKLPNDVITGQPLKYQWTEDGHYAIYSVGWNEKDEGGAATFKKGEHDVPEDGDWVWR